MRPPDPPLEDRHGVPDMGPCIRCNVQIEGSGPRPDDVIDRRRAGRVGRRRHRAARQGRRHPGRPRRRHRHSQRQGAPRGRARHLRARERRLSARPFKTFYGGEYGVLTFVEDHGLMQNCEAAGSGDSGLYPGAGADTGDQRDTTIYPSSATARRSATATRTTTRAATRHRRQRHARPRQQLLRQRARVHDRVFTAPGHPGFPQDSDLVENNNFYSNNFNPYVAGSDVEPSVPVPVGTGMWIAGGNDNVVRNNYFYDNWRRGVMLFAVPDQVICGPAGDRPDTARRLQPDRRPAVDLVPQPVLRQHDGQVARAARSSRTAPAT